MVQARDAAEDARFDIGEKWRCPDCGREHSFGAYAAAHWHLEMTHGCTCGAKTVWRNGRVTSRTPAPQRGARRAEFSPRTKRQAWERSGGRCEAENCGRKIFPGDGPEYDHRIPDAAGGDNSLKNCQVLCAWCHSEKYPGDRKTIAKVQSVTARHARAKGPKGPQSPWKPRPPTKRYPRGYAVHRETGEIRER